MHARPFLAKQLDEVLIYHHLVMSTGTLQSPFEASISPKDDF
jgi:hypothetical protein